MRGNSRLIWLLASSASAGALQGQRNYHFEGSLSREVLDNYLSRSITMMDLCTGKGNVDDNIRMLKNTGAKFAGRAIYLWRRERRIADPAFLSLADRTFVARAAPGSGTLALCEELHMLRDLSAQPLETCK